MRNKSGLKQWVQEHPDRIFVMSRDPRDFRPWIDDLRKGKPLILEVGMGRGDFLVSQARKHPELFFLGLEIKGDRVYRAFEKAGTAQLENIAFLLCHAHLLPNFQLPKVEHVYVLFPDPWPKTRHSKHRLSFGKYLQIYQSLLKPSGSFILKTDDTALFEFTLESLNENDWNILRQETSFLTPEDELTGYERRFRAQNKAICFVEATPPKTEEKTLYQA